MGMIDRFLGGPGLTAAGNAVTGVAEVFRQNETRRMELDEEAYARAIGQLGQEFAHPPGNWFDSFINALNRVPRPLMTLSVLGLFGYAMVDPVGFDTRMLGLQRVPEPLWWLLGAVVSFYFGAREAHYFRNRVWPQQVVTQAAVQANGRKAAAATVVTRNPTDAADQAPVPAAAEVAPAAVLEMMPADAADALPAPGPRASFADNPALQDWASVR